MVRRVLKASLLLLVLGISCSLSAKVASLVDVLNEETLVQYSGQENNIYFGPSSESITAKDRFDAAVSEVHRGLQSEDGRQPLIEFYFEGNQKFINAVNDLICLVIEGAPSDMALYRAANQAVKLTQIEYDKLEYETSEDLKKERLYYLILIRQIALISKIASSNGLIDVRTNPDFKRTIKDWTIRGLDSLFAVKDWCMDHKQFTALMVIIAAAAAKNYYDGKSAAPAGRSDYVEYPETVPASDTEHYYDGASSDSDYSELDENDEKIRNATTKEQQHIIKHDNRIRENMSEVNSLLAKVGVKSSDEIDDVDSLPNEVRDGLVEHSQAIVDACLRGLKYRDKEHKKALARLGKIEKQLRAVASNIENRERALSKIEVEHRHLQDRVDAGETLGNKEAKRHAKLDKAVIKLKADLERYRLERDGDNVDSGLNQEKANLESKLQEIDKAIEKTQEIQKQAQDDSKKFTVKLSLLEKSRRLVGKTKREAQRRAAGSLRGVAEDFVEAADDLETKVAEDRRAEEERQRLVDEHSMETQRLEAKQEEEMQALKEEIEAEREEKEKSQSRFEKLLRRMERKIAGDKKLEHATAEDLATAEDGAFGSDIESDGELE